MAGGGRQLSNFVKLYKDFKVFLIFEAKIGKCVTRVHTSEQLWAIHSPQTSQIQILEEASTGLRVGAIP